MSELQSQFGMNKIHISIYQPNSVGNLVLLLPTFESVLLFNRPSERSLCKVNPFARHGGEQQKQKSISKNYSHTCREFDFNVAGEPRFLALFGEVNPNRFWMTCGIYCTDASSVERGWLCKRGWGAGVKRRVWGKRRAPWLCLLSGFLSARVRGRDPPCPARVLAFRGDSAVSLGKWSCQQRGYLFLSPTDKEVYLTALLSIFCHLIFFFFPPNPSHIFNSLRLAQQARHCVWGLQCHQFSGSLLPFAQDLMWVYPTCKMCFVGSELLPNGKSWFVGLNCSFFQHV